ncbi:MAG: hypothetical protein M0C28_14290 [Candidatus Moduliflexus flocculans]|nr:hypothetical protein [Candidatus Moduliflexus flocculans]
MIHLILLAYAMTVVMGTASAAYVLQARRSLKYDYLRPFYAYAVIFLVSMFGGQILEYVYLNILGGASGTFPGDHDDLDRISRRGQNDLALCRRALDLCHEGAPGERFVPLGLYPYRRFEFVPLRRILADQTIPAGVHA